MGALGGKVHAGRQSAVGRSAVGASARPQQLAIPIADCRLPTTVLPNPSFTFLADLFSSNFRHSRDRGQLWQQQNCVLQKLHAAQKAKARARARSRGETLAPANDNIVPFEAAEPLHLTAEYVVRPDNEDDAPFAPPPVDDIFGMDEIDEEETIFVAEEVLEVEEPGAEPEPALEAEAAPEAEIEAPELAPEAEAAIEAPPFDLDDDIPFDPPEFDDEPVFKPAASAQLAPAATPAIEPRLELVETAALSRGLQPIEIPRDRPVPAISIYASWDRPEAEALLKDFARDPRLVRAEIAIARGGLDGAESYFAGGGQADLVILDTTLQGGPMLAALDRMLEAAPPSARTVVIGGVNDIGLLRELAQRGVADYVVPPAKAEDLARSACQLFAEADNARVIAVIGARGGVGASTIAHNIAWSIAERQGQRAALVDLDLPFGSSAAAFEHDATEMSVADVVEAGENADETTIRAMTPITKRLSLLAAPAAVESVELEPAAFDTLLAHVRRSAPYVVLDLPHAWEPWVRQALKAADELVLVASPDLASLRNADNMLKLLRSERDKASAPVVVLSMAGVPKRPEISLKEFGDALKVKPAMTFAFEPELFAKATAAGRMICETMPDAKAALQLDTLASQLTGREPKLQPAPRTKPQSAPKSEPALAREAPPPEPVLELTTLAPEPAVPPASSRHADGRQDAGGTVRPYRAARSGFLALQAPPEKRRRSSGLVRAAMALVALALAGAWYVQKQQETASRFDFPSAFAA